MPGDRAKDDFRKQIPVAPVVYDPGPNCTVRSNDTARSTTARGDLKLVAPAAPGAEDNGAVDSLDAVLGNVTHRSAGRALTSAADRAKVVRFLQAIDARTAPAPGS